MSINAQTTNRPNTQATGMAMMKMVHREHALNKMFLFKLLCFIFIWSSDRFGISPADCKCRQKLSTQVKGKFFVTCSIIRLNKCEKMALENATYVQSLFNKK